MTKFSELNLNPKVLKAVEEAGYTEPTPIQAGAIPPALAGRDILGIAQTGTGKTASFTLPMLSLLARGHARAPSGSFRARQAVADRRSDHGRRRGRPDARHGLHP